jgi:hypothetical protein
MGIKWPSAIWQFNRDFVHESDGIPMGMQVNVINLQQSANLESLLWRIRERKMSKSTGIQKGGLSTAFQYAELDR